MKISKIFNIIKQLWSCKNFIIYATSDNINNLKLYSSDNIDNDWQAYVFNDIKENLISKLGNEKYGSKLELYDKDLFDAYEDLNKQYIKANYFESLYNYYKSVNDPNGGDANKTFMLYKKLLIDKDKYQKVNNKNEI